MDKAKCTLYTGGLQGSESCFVELAEKWGLNEVQYSFAGQKLAREKNVVLLSEEELRRGDISMELVSKKMGRNYYEANKIRKVLQTIFHMVNSGFQVFSVGTIRDDNTVKGGTGWAVELGKWFNRPVSVYWQEKQQWYTWKDGGWQEDTPRISHDTFVGTGTRNLTDDGAKAIEALFEASFGSPA